MTYEAGQIWQYNNDEEGHRVILIMVEFIKSETDYDTYIEDWRTYSLTNSNFQRWRLYDNEEWTRLA